MSTKSKIKPFGKYKWIVTHPDLLGGKPTIKGTRISVSMVLECLANSMTPEEIANDYPGFPIGSVSEVLKFAAAQADKKLRSPNAVA